MSKKKAIKAYNKLQEAFEVFKTAINEAEEAGLNISCESQLVESFEDAMYEITEDAGIAELVDN